MYFYINPSLMLICTIGFSGTSRRSIWHQRHTRKVLSVLQIPFYSWKYNNNTNGEWHIPLAWSKNLSWCMRKGRTMGDTKSISLLPSTGVSNRTRIHCKKNIQICSIYITSFWGFTTCTRNWNLSLLDKFLFFQRVIILWISLWSWRATPI